MPELVETNKAIAQMEEQLIRSQSLPIEHLRILASNKGRFAHDRFYIFHHELQLQEALLLNEDIDVKYAREKIKFFANEMISIIMAEDLIANHVASINLPQGQDRLKRLHNEREASELVKKKHIEVIRNLRIVN